MSDTMTIKTNNVPRDVLYWYELTDAERAEFDYLDSDTAQSEASFFRYHGIVYDLGEFIRIDGNGSVAPHPQRYRWEQWDGYRSDSYFSGMLVRYVEDCERVIVATYYC